MKIKQYFTAFMAGMMTLVTVTCAQVSEYLSHNPVIKPVKEQLTELWTGIMIKGENAVVSLKYLAFNRGRQLAAKQEEGLAQENKMMIELNKSQALCRQSGILLRPQEMKGVGALNGPPYRGSG